MITSYIRKTYFSLYVGCLAFLASLVLLGIMMTVCFDLERTPRYANVALNFEKNEHSFRFADIKIGIFLLQNGLPALEMSTYEDDALRFFYFNWSEFYWRLAANVRRATPFELLQSQLPTLFSSEIPREKPQDSFPKNAVESLPLPSPIPLPIIENIPDKPVVLLLHTHTTESYLPHSGRERSDPKKNELGDIVTVAEFLKKELEEKHQIPVVHCKTIHDSYPFRESYNRSLNSAKKYLEKYPSIKVVLDIHRDATPGIKATCTVNGQNHANLLLVVGTDRMGLEHPHWRLNEAFAQRLIDLMQRSYPELDSDILVAKARYNQHLHPKYLILEVGDHQTAMIEAQRSTAIFAEILAKALKTPFNPQ